MPVRYQIEAKIFDFDNRQLLLVTYRSGVVNTLAEATQRITDITKTIEEGLRHSFPVIRHILVGHVLQNEGCIETVARYHARYIGLERDIYLLQVALYDPSEQQEESSSASPTVRPDA